jgi:hypothetical protein
MSKKRIKIFLLWMALSFAATVPTASEANWLCDILRRKQIEPTEYVEFTGFSRKLPVPIGLKPQYFREYLEIMMADNSVGGLIFFGSRTHFDYGYQPKLRSDMDLMIFQKRGGVPDGMERSFAESERLGRMHSINSPALFQRRELSFEETIDNMKGSFAYPRTQDEEMRIFSEAAENASGVFRRSSEKENVKDSMAQFPGEKFKFNKQSVIIVKSGEYKQEHLEFLRSHGFSNIFVYSPMPSAF